MRLSVHLVNKGSIRVGKPKIYCLDGFNGYGKPEARNYPRKERRGAILCECWQHLRGKDEGDATYSLMQFHFNFEVSTLLPIKANNQSTKV